MSWDKEKIEYIESLGLKVKVHVNINVSLDNIKKALPLYMEAGQPSTFTAWTCQITNLGDGLISISSYDASSWSGGRWRDNQW
jgi:aminopeptidase C